MSVFNRTQNSFTSLTAADGIPGTSYSFGAAQKDREGNILLGTSEGVLICNANQIELHRTKITAAVEDVKINGRSISFADNSFEIIPDNKVINFTFSASPAFFSGNIIYQYRLRGQSDEWISLPPGVYTVSYTGLPYKKLVLEVRAATSLDNLKRSPTASIRINSEPSFWKTTLFIFIAALVSISLIVGMILRLNRRKYKKQLELLRIEQGLQSERERIGRDLHDNIGAYTSALIAGLNHIKPTDAPQAKQINDLKGPNIFAGTPFEQAPSLDCTLDIQITETRAVAKLQAGGHDFEVEMSGFSAPYLINREPADMPPFHQQGVEIHAMEVTLKVDGKKIEIIIPPVGITGGPASCVSPVGVCAR